MTAPLPPNDDPRYSLAHTRLLEALRQPESAEQKQVVTHILRTNPQLMALFLRNRQQQQQQQQPQQQPQQQQPPGSQSMNVPTARADLRLQGSTGEGHPYGLYRASAAPSHAGPTWSFSSGPNVMLVQNWNQNWMGPTFQSPSTGPSGAPPAGPSGAPPAGPSGAPPAGPSGASPAGPSGAPPAGSSGPPPNQAPGPSGKYCVQVQYSSSQGQPRPPNASSLSLHHPPSLQPPPLYSSFNWPSYPQQLSNAAPGPPSFFVPGPSQVFSSANPPSSDWSAMLSTPQPAQPVRSRLKAPSQSMHSSSGPTQHQQPGSPYPAPAFSAAVKRERGSAPSPTAGQQTQPQPGSSNQGLSSVTLKTENDASTPTASTSKTDGDSLCVICCSQPATTAFIPCGHRHYCLSCAQAAFAVDKACPYCRSRSKTVTKIFL